MTDLTQIQKQLQNDGLDGWLLYDFRGQNPIALHVAKMQSSGSRRWFLWIPAEGEPHWLIHAIEGTTFSQATANFGGTVGKYVSWQELAGKLRNMILPKGGASGATSGGAKIAMEYSPFGAIPYVSKVDAGIKEMVEEATSAEVISSADLVQLVQAVLTPDQISSHKAAAKVCLDAKDLAFNFVRESLVAGHAINEFDVQTVIMDHFAANHMDIEHPPIVAVNANAADPHYSPAENRHSPVQVGDMLLLDIFARQANDPQNCFGDVTWTAYCGESVPEKVKAVFEVVAASRDRAVSFINEKLAAGETVYGYEVDEAARAVISDAGYGDGILHRTGHSLGTAVHFNGVNIDNLETQDKRSLIPGVMFTVEPGIYYPELNFDDGPTAKGLGIRSEINCLMHEDRAEVTTLPLQVEVPALLK